MSRRLEDFDEFCDPDNPRIIQYQEVLDAADRLQGHGLNTPCLASHYQKELTMSLFYKLELLQRTGSFKERGSLNALQLLPLDKKKLGVVCASVGNDAVGLCYHASKMNPNVPVIVVLPVSVPIYKVQQCHNYGAKVVIQGTNLMESQRYARAIARDKGLTYINCRDHPHVLAGYGTIALEILEQVPFVDAIIVPVGSGGLAAAVCSVVKHLKPNCLVYGVQPESMPVLFKSLENEEPATLPMASTLGDAVAVPNVGVNAFANLQPHLNKMLLVNEDWIARSILYFMEKERFIVEGAAATTFAAILGNLVPELKLKHVVCILSGGNVDNILLSRCFDRGMAAEGRLVKFRVYVNDSSKSKAQLLKLLSNGGYNIISEFQDSIWVQDEIYTVEIKLTVQTRGLEHALELKRMMEKAYPCSAVFETEPFNDKRTCPCYVQKCST
ncbi:hypothetical protein K1T71_010727 [Dendrolimus kikuchii]|uniref:Uncharacterized protein n=1 Tax=Dendrolimus kikuchii TaxID=765133 RepID=A0ACC1CPX1_9NEOP|nr:hypothetical protein K1T71_010727 [Dendrolimus kikuchii]